MTLPKFGTPKDVIQKFKDNELPEKFCLVPFTTLIAYPDGKVGVCRQKGPEYFIGDLREQTLEEIWNSPVLQNWRNEFLTGNIVTCKEEMENDSCNLCTLNNTLLDEIETSENQSGHILKLGANFNGECNLKCRMCRVWLKPNGYYTDTGFIEKAKTNLFPYLKEIDLFSGEPLIQEDTWDLIDTISEINPDCEWTFTTNGIWSFEDKVEPYLDKIKIKNIIVSIDSLDHEKFKKIRIMGELQTVLRNIEKLKKYEEKRLANGQTNLDLILNCTVQTDNWHEIGDIMDLADKNNIKCSFRVVTTPSKFSILGFPNEKKMEILDFYLENLTRKQLLRATRMIKSLTLSLPKKDYKVYLMRLSQAMMPA